MHMNIDNVLLIEDSTTKYMEIFRYLRRQGFSRIDWVSNAEDAINHIEESTQNNTPYDLIISDMHFDYFGVDDREAGEKLMNLIHEKGFNIPIIFCSSQNWKIPGSIGNIFYNPRRNWEFEADELFRRIKAKQL